MKILNVAYPLAPVGPDAVGGAEQVLTYIAEGLTAAGQESFVLACDGSKIDALLFTVTVPQGMIDSEARRKCHYDLKSKIQEIIARGNIDLVHFHGVDFYEYLPSSEIPILATLHLPLLWYPEHIFGSRRLTLQCVSASQRRSGPVSLRPAIENGVPIHQLQAPRARENFALCLGRICPEKGFHHALAATKRAKISCVLAGQVFPYESHIAYFRSELTPLLDSDRRFIGPVGFERKKHLLNSARCLLISSTVPETSSLIAMEALACGTPVIAFPVGALPEIIDHGKTGFLVKDEKEMSEAIEAVERIDPAACQEMAARRFDVTKMVDRYLDLYRQLLGKSSLPPAAHSQEICHVG